MDYSILYTAYGLLFGLIVGSFLNVVIHRLPIMLQRSWKSDCEAFLAEEQTQPLPEGTFNLAIPGSHCPKCNKKITIIENIPLFSYLFLGGKCSACKTKISLRYPIVELITGIVTGFSIYQFGLNEQGYLAVLLGWGLIALTLIDADTQLLPDSITLPLLWLGLLANSFNIYTDLASAVYGAAAGYFSLWSIYWLFKLTTGKEGMGYGDFKLLAALGAWMGWQHLPLIVILSAFVGAVVGISGIIFKGKNKETPIPYGPYLATAGWIAFFWGNEITQAYLSQLGS